MTKKPEKIEIETSLGLVVREDDLYYKKNSKIPFTGIMKAESPLPHIQSFKNGKLHGSGEIWGENGHLIEKCEYKIICQLKLIHRITRHQILTIQS